MFALCITVNRNMDVIGKLNALLRLTCRRDPHEVTLKKDAYSALRRNFSPQRRIGGHFQE